MAKQLKHQFWGIGLFKLALICSVLSFLITCWLIVKLLHVYQYHQHLEKQTMPKPDIFGGHETSYAIFLKAYLHNNQGQQEKALATYAKVASVANKKDVLVGNAHFNSGNTYLKMATEKLEQEGLPGWDVAGPLVALAKESYQKALRANPHWSEAKYNYQLALRLAPTSHGMRGPQQYEDENIKQDEKPSGWPAMPGNPRGMH